MKFSVLILAAISEPKTVSLNDIHKCADFEHLRGDHLGFFTELNCLADEHEIVLTPSPSSIINWDKQIVVTRFNDDDPDAIGKKIQNELEGSELPKLEFKSTLYFDINRHQSNPNTDLSELKALHVCHSSMKNICAFLNDGGGSLIIGMADNGEPYGLENEFHVTCPTDKTIDGWLQEFRNAIFSFFHEPGEVFHHITQQVGKIDEKYVVKLNIISRKKLSICKCKKRINWSIYTKNATSVDSVSPTEIEGYLFTRFKRLDSL